MLWCCAAAAAAQAHTARATLQIGATVVESAEAGVSKGTDGKAQLWVRSSPAAAISADAGIELRGTPGSWRATAGSPGGAARYVTVTYF